MFRLFKKKKDPVEAKLLDLIDKLKNHYTEEVTLERLDKLAFLQTRYQKLQSFAADTLGMAERLLYLDYVKNKLSDLTEKEQSEYNRLKYTLTMHHRLSVLEDLIFNEYIKMKQFAEKLVKDEKYKKRVQSDVELYKRIKQILGIEE